MIQFLINSQHFTHDRPPAFDANYVYVDEVMGHAWAQILRVEGARWSPVPASQSWLMPLDQFPAYCPGSLITPLWQDQLIYAELPRPLLERELTVLDQAVARLRSGNSIWYNPLLKSSTEWSPAMQPSAEIIQSLAQARLKLSRGELTDDELREALKQLRQHRTVASDVSAKSRAAKKSVDGEALLSALIG